VLFTGTNTALTLAGMADDIEVIGGSYSMANVSGAMGMWFNGLRAGSGARNVRVKGAYIDMSAALTSPGPCVRASGGGSDMDIDVSCKGTTSATYALDASAGGDAGGFPSRVRFRGDLFGWTVSNLLVNMDAPDSSVDNLTCRSSTYTYIVGGSGSNVAANDLTFNCATGSSGRFNLTHATSGSACERTSAGGAVRCIGLVLSSSVFRLVSSTPASATAACAAGDFAADAGFLYYCIAANQWRRAAMVAW